MEMKMEDIDSGLITVTSGSGLRLARLEMLPDTSPDYILRCFAKLCKESVDDLTVNDTEEGVVVVHKDYVSSKEEDFPEQATEYHVQVWLRNNKVFEHTYKADDGVGTLTFDMSITIRSLAYKSLTYRGKELNANKRFKDILQQKNARIFIKGASNALINFVTTGRLPLQQENLSAEDYQPKHQSTFKSLAPLKLDYHSSSSASTIKQKPKIKKEEK